VLTPQALDLLLRFDWPGNVRELENEMERALAMASGGSISHDVLSEKILRLSKTQDSDESGNGTGTLKETIRQTEKKMIGEVLASYRGNKTKAAQALGLSRQGLTNKIIAYNLVTKPQLNQST
jgi:two-component system, NtrC family, response regulator HupR/HoxA